MAEFAEEFGWTPLPWRYDRSSAAGRAELEAVETWGLRARGRDQVKASAVGGEIDVRCVHQVSLWADCPRCAESLQRTTPAT